MTQLARSLAAAVLGLASNASVALTASPPQFTVSVSIASHCMVATAAARDVPPGVDQAAASRDVLVACSKDASVGSVRLEPAPGIRRRQRPDGANLQLQWVRMNAPGMRDARTCAGVPAGVVRAPLVLCAAVRDPGGAVADRGRPVTVMVTYE